MEQKQLIVKNANLTRAILFGARGYDLARYVAHVSNTVGSRCVPKLPTSHSNLTEVTHILPVVVLLYFALVIHVCHLTS